MLAKERLRYILQRIQIDHAVSVTTLSKELNVSLSTVQRDLRKLVDRGEIEREHGGALTSGFTQTLSSTSEQSVDNKVDLQKEEKQRIAQTAAKMIQDGDCIFVDSGTTTTYLVPYLMNRNITIVTNSHYLVQKLRGCKAELIVLGGKYDAKYDMNYGSITLQAIGQLQFDSCFISANGWDLKTQEVSTVESDNGIIKENVMGRSKKCYLLMDSSKYRVRAMFTFALEKAFDRIFVDYYPLNYKRSQNVEICEERD